MALWRECAQWLNRHNLVANNDPVFGSQATAHDLVALLRDGTVLCRLIHILDPDSIDMSRVVFDETETGRSVSDFICRQNIFLFLHGVISDFELKDDLIFQPEELYHCQDISRVLETLSALSYSPKALESGVPGFPKKEKQLSKKLKQERKIYESLAEVYGEAETEYIYDSFSRSRELDQSHYEDIYQTIFPPKQPRLGLDISFGKKSKRAAPIQELIDTEDTYLENLIMVRDVFRNSLTAMASQHKDVIFFHLDDLITLHSDILFGLKQKRVDVGSIFLQHMARVGRVYSLYCMNLPVAVETLEQLQNSNNTLQKQVIDCQLRAKPSTFPLSSHLVIPFQRFLKYHLLLKEILKYTPQDHKERTNLEKACQEMHRINLEANEKKREQEESEKQAKADESEVRIIENVRQSIKLMQLADESKLTDFGRLRKGGEVVVYNEQVKAADYVFLFDMLIVLCQKPKWLQHRYRFVQALRVKEYFLEPILPPEKAPNLDVFSVRLFKRADARRPPVTFITKTSPERDSWFHAILTAMDSVNPSENASQGHVLQLTTFHGAHECFQCSKRLLGTFFQGYRCLRCQVTLHKACISDCRCIEFGGVKRVDSVTLPTAIPDNLERSSSTLSLAPSDTKRNSARLSQEAREMQQKIQNEKENLPLEFQPYFAGQLSAKIASERLEALPIGTFLVRQRANGEYALMLKTGEKPKGVKAMAIYKVHDENMESPKYCFSDARHFDSIQKMIAFYETRDLLENFDYDALKGVCLKIPYSNV